MTEIVKTVPRNATYTSHEIQNELIDVMSSTVKEAIVQEVGENFKSGLCSGSDIQQTWSSSTTATGEGRQGNTIRALS